MLKICFISSRLDCNDGVASHIELLASQLSAFDVELTMITGLTTGQEVAANRYAALRRLFPRWHQISQLQLKARLGTAKEVASILRRENVEIVHVHGIRTLLLARMATMGMKIPLVTTYHPSAHGAKASDFRLSKDMRERVLYRLFLEALRPQSLIALSSDTEKLFRQEAGWRRVRKILCGVDTGHFRVPTGEERAEARASVGVEDDSLVVVLPGRLNLNKGHDVIVAGLSELRKSDPTLKLKCLFPGAGVQAAEIKAMIDACPDPGMFKMLGFVPDIRIAYWASDVAILPSRNEGFALVIAEAMACGCAAIRTPSGGCTDQIVEGETGYVVRFNSPEDVTARLRSLCVPGVLQRMRGHAARHAQVAFSAARMGVETMALYRECLWSKEFKLRVTS